MDNGENNPPVSEQPQEQQERKKGLIDRANNAVDTARNVRSNIQNVRNLQSVQKFVQTARATASTIRAGMAIANPPVLIAIGLLLLGVAIVIFFPGGGSSDKRRYFGADPSPVPGTDPGTDPNNPIPNLTLEKSGPTAVGNGEDITYTINARYGESLDVTVVDRIPNNTQYLEATGVKVVDNANGLVSWRLSENTPTRVNEAEGENIYTFTLTVRPTRDDIIVENTLSATAPGGTTGPAPETNDFTLLMAGQGRNTGIMGDENNFVTTAISNLGSRLSNPSQYEQYFHLLYQKSLQYNVNPAIMVTIWGVEQSFAINNSPFSCPPPREGWGQTIPEQFDCAPKSLDRLMKEFDSKRAAQGGTLPVFYDTGEAKCPFMDPFLYAYEAYTPVCSMNDSNDEARGNFVIIYKQTLYGKQ